MNDARRVCSNIRMITYCEVHRFTFSLLFGISVYVCWKGLTGVPGIVESSYEQSIITESPFFASKFPSFLYMLSRQTQQINFTGGCGCSICPWWGRTQRRRYQIEHIFCRHTCLMLPLWSMSYGYRGDIEKINRWSTVGDACLKDLYVVCEVVECSYSR